MKHRNYQSPTMKVVKLQHTGMLMVSGEGRSSSAGVQDYTWQNVDEE